jgi:ketosteroid isomerase-like protein
MSDEGAIRGAIDAWNERGVDAFLEHVSPDIEWRPPAGFPQGDVWLGRDELSREMHDQFDELYDSGTVDVRSVEPGPGGWLIAVRHSTHARSSGMELKWAAWYVWTIEDGLIRRSRIFLDREAAEQEAGL